jgi:hypothetical protein
MEDPVEPVGCSETASAHQNITPVLERVIITYVFQFWINLAEKLKYVVGKVNFGCSSHGERERRNM